MVNKNNWFHSKDKELLNFWSEEMESNIRSLFQLMDPKRDLGDLRNYREYNKGSAWKNIESKMEQKSNRIIYFYRAAAAIALVLGAIFVFQLWGSSGDSPVITIQSAEKQIVELPDGSKIYLDEGSSLSYHPDEFAKARFVTFEGRANFDVTSMEGNLFEVRSSDLTVRVLGTQFEINTNGPNDEVIVTEGVVEIDSDSDGEQIQAGQKAVIVDASIEVEDLEDIVLRQWLDNRLEYDDVSVGEVISDISEEFGVTVDLNSKSNNLKCKLNTEFYNETLLEILDEFKTLFGAETNFQDNTIYIKNLQCE